MSAFNRDRLKGDLAALARQGVFIGTSSWKYRGWCGQLYDESRYVWRGRFAEKRFEQHCLAEYAEVFKTVCVDAAYYRFPDQRYLEGLVSQVPADFQFALKVTDFVTIKKFTMLARFGARAGQPNDDFLNADLFASAFINPCAPFKQNIGLLMFEFSHFYPNDYKQGRDFAGALDAFLEKIPPGWPYGVEIRNKHFLHPDYFAVLKKHGVAAIYNSWTGMPSVLEQAAMPESVTNESLCGARFLLKPGRTYTEAVELFSPYETTKEVYEEGRTAGGFLIRQGLQFQARRKTFIYVNNRLEGNALATIAAMIELAGVTP